MAVGQQPVWDDDGERIERVAQRGSDTFQAVERTDGGQHVGGVAALPTSRTQQATRAKLGQQGVVQHILSLPVHQPLAKLTQHRGIKASIHQW